MSLDNKEFGLKLAELRKSEGLNQGEFAQRMGVSTNTLGMYERGSRKPDAEFLYLLYEYFNTDLHWLLTGESQPAPKLKNNTKEVIDHAIIYHVLQTSVDFNRITILGGDTAVEFGEEFIKEYEKLYFYKNRPT